MNNTPVMKIGIVAVSRDCFPESLSVTRRQNLVKAYEAKYGKGDIYECPVCIVESEIHMMQALEDIKNIIVKMTSQLSHRLEEMDVQLELSEEVKVWIAENAYEPAYGARPLKRYLTKVIENPLAKLIIGGKIPPKSKVIVTLVDNKIDFDIQTIAE